MLQERYLEVREPESFIMGGKHDYPLLQRKILSLSFKAVRKPVFTPDGKTISSSKAFYYTNILEKIIQNKGSQCLYI